MGEHIWSSRLLRGLEMLDRVMVASDPRSTGHRGPGIVVPGFPDWGANLSFWIGGDRQLRQRTHTTNSHHGQKRLQGLRVLGEERRRCLQLEYFGLLRGMGSVGRHRIMRYGNSYFRGWSSGVSRLPQLLRSLRPYVRRRWSPGFWRQCCMALLISFCVDFVDSLTWADWECWMVDWLA